MWVVIPCLLISCHHRGQRMNQLSEGKALLGRPCSVSSVKLGKVFFWAGNRALFEGFWANHFTVLLTLCTRMRLICTISERNGYVFIKWHIGPQASFTLYLVRKYLSLWHKVLSCHLGAFTSKCVSALFLLHRVHLRIVLCLYFVTYFPLVVKNGAIVSFIGILRGKKGDCQRGESNAGMNCLRTSWTVLLECAADLFLCSLPSSSASWKAPFVMWWGGAWSRT